MEISKQTAEELKAQRQKEYDEWNKKINSYAEEILDILREKQIPVSDATEVLKIVNTILSAKVGLLNINYVLNNK